MESFNSDDRIQFYGHALISTGDVDETGHPLVRRAMSDADALRMAMQGISHAAFTMWPDVVLFVSGFFVTPGIMGLLQNRRMKVVLLATESPYQEKMQLDRAQCSDITLLNDPVNIEQYRDLGIVAEYAPHAYRPSHPLPETVWTPGEHRPGRRPGVHRDRVRVPGRFFRTDEPGRPGRAAGRLLAHGAALQPAAVHGSRH